MRAGFVVMLVTLWSLPLTAQTASRARFKVLAFYENGGHHIEYSKKAVVWLNRLAADSNFVVEFRNTTDDFSDQFLSQYRLLIQLDFVPYGWRDNARQAFMKYMEEGRGGWVGFHHASLLGEFDGYSMWPWFYRFMGSIRFENYIPDFASGVVHVEERTHPVFRNVPNHFVVKKEEWYTYDQSPRKNVHVLASVDESSYRPDSVTIKMGDHPVIWSNQKIKARNIYIFMGHGPELWDNEVYRTLVKNAIFWASER